MKLQFGFIGQNEIELAKEKLIESYSLGDGGFEDKKIWFEKPHTGNYIKGYAYNDVVEVLENETTTILDTFHGMFDVESYIEEFDYDFSDKDIDKFNSIFNEDKIAYMIDGEINNDKEYICWNRIEDGQYIWKGSIVEAYNKLCEESVDKYTELLVIGLLQR